MNARHLHPSARKNTAAVRRDPGAATPAASPADIPGMASDVASWIGEAA